MMDKDTSDKLRKPFPREAVGKLPKGGVMLDYVGHAAVTDRLLAIDPEWLWVPLATDEAGLPLLDKAGNLWIKLTIAGVTRIGVGDGKSAKEAIGDAIRNAAMRFGVALDLWSKEELESSHLDSPPPESAPPSAAAKARAWQAIRRLYPDQLPDELRAKTEQELAAIGSSISAAGVAEWTMLADQLEAQL